MSLFISLLITISLLILTRLKFKLDQEIREGNVAASFRYGGFVLALLIGLSGSLNFHIGVTVSQLDLLKALADGALVFVLLNFSLILNDKLILSKVDNSIEISKNNIAVGLFEFMYLISTGIIINASSSGNGTQFETILYFLLGQVFLFLIFFLYKTTFKKLEKFLNEGSVASALLVGGTLISYSLIIHSAMIGESDSLILGIQSFLIYSLLGSFALFILFNEFIDRLFLPLSKISDELSSGNISGILLLTSFKVGLAFILSINL